MNNKGSSYLAKQEISHAQRRKIVQSLSQNIHTDGNNTRQLQNIDNHRTHFSQRKISSKDTTYTTASAQGILAKDWQGLNVQIADKSQFIDDVVDHIMTNSNILPEMKPQAAAIA